MTINKLKPQDLEKIREQVLKKVQERFQKEFKPEAKAKITPEMIERAVNEAIKGCTSADIALANEYSDFFCDKCGECCRKCDPIRVSIQDLLSITMFLGISLDTTIANYTKTLKDGAFPLKSNPCIFLQGNQCSIYPARPLVCRAFPIVFIKHHATLDYHDYCKFTEKVLVQKAIGFLLRYLMDMDRPELSLALEMYMKQLAEKMPKDYPSQLLFWQKYFREMNKKQNNRGKWGNRGR